jgi:adenine-specific DNA-methyltransferase
MDPYYADDWVTLYHGRAEDVLPTIAPDSVDVLLTDPPYFQVKDEEWDRQWKQRDEFLTWLGRVVDAAAPALRPSASVWVFASAALTSTVELEVVAPRFRVLNSVRWVKTDSAHNKAEIAARRRYPAAWEGILFAEPRDGAVSPLAAYIRAERIRAGWSTNDLEVALGYVETRRPGIGTRLCGRWEEGASIPSADAYHRMRDVLNDRGGGDYLRREYEDLRRPFNLTRAVHLTDTWEYRPVQGYPGKHPCEKPIVMLSDMICVSSKPGALILDPFVGSGSTLRAAKDTGRRAIGIEMDERWCEHAARRLTQEAFDFDGAR